MASITNSDKKVNDTNLIGVHTARDQINQVTTAETSALELN